MPAMNPVEIPNGDNCGFGDFFGRGKVEYFQFRYFFDKSKIKA